MFCVVVHQHRRRQPMRWQQAMPWLCAAHVILRGRAFANPADYLLRMSYLESTLPNLQMQSVQCNSLFKYSTQSANEISAMSYPASILLPTHKPNHRNYISRASTLPHTTPIHPRAIAMMSFHIHKARPAPSMRSRARLYVRFAAWDMAVRHHPWGISICARGRACPVYRPAPASRAHPISPGRTARTAPRLSRQALWLCPWWRADRRVRSTLS